MPQQFMSHPIIQHYITNIADKMTMYGKKIIITETLNSFI